MVIDKMNSDFEIIESNIDPLIEDYVKQPAENYDDFPITMSDVLEVTRDKCSVYHRRLVEIKRVVAYAIKQGNKETSHNAIHGIMKFVKDIEDE